MSSPIVVIGAGLAGLSCAKRLSKVATRDVLLLEASDRVGGRVTSDVIDGFILDRGFQVLQTAYPEARELLDYDALDLVELEPGAVVWKSGKWNRMADPLRRPSQVLATMFNDVGSVPDRWRLLKMKNKILSQKKNPFEIEQHASPEQDLSTAEYLESFGFSSDFTESFLRPWISGMFLERELNTSAEYFKFVFRMLSTDSVTLPAGGMKAIPEQLASGIQGELRLNAPVDSVVDRRVHLKDGSKVDAAAVVVATDQRTAFKILDQDFDAEDSKSTTCIYFAADKPPTDERALMLNGESGLVNHVYVPTNSVPAYSKSGRALISVNLVDSTSQEFQMSSVKAELQEWFRYLVADWKHLKTYRIEHALPAQPAGFFAGSTRKLSAGQFLCGDYCESGSIQGAMLSGRKASGNVLRFLQEVPS
ncbi:MAG: NAD(P)/FAD-dependent oxidoreductase [Planctomycetota bacterium]|nr:NAD(P)/FAD-dependent oxidoreductase [Planctomycetota bacterium]